MRRTPRTRTFKDWATDTVNLCGVKKSANLDLRPLLKTHVQAYKEFYRNAIYNADSREARHLYANVFDKINRQCAFAKYWETVRGMIEHTEAADIRLKKASKFIISRRTNRLILQDYVFMIFDPETVQNYWYRHNNAQVLSIERPVAPNRTNIDVLSDEILEPHVTDVPKMEAFLFDCRGNLYGPQIYHIPDNKHNTNRALLNDGDKELEQFHAEEANFQSRWNELERLLFASEIAEEEIAAKEVAFQQTTAIRTKCKDETRLRKAFKLLREADIDILELNVIDYDEFWETDQFSDALGRKIFLQSAFQESEDKLRYDASDTIDFTGAYLEVESRTLFDHIVPTVFTSSVAMLMLLRTELAYVTKPPKSESEPDIVDDAKVYLEFLKTYCNKPSLLAVYTDDFLESISEISATIDSLGPNEWLFRIRDAVRPTQRDIASLYDRKRLMTINATHIDLLDSLEIFVASKDTIVHLPCGDANNGVMFLPSLLRSIESNTAPRCAAALLHPNLQHKIYKFDAVTKEVTTDHVDTMYYEVDASGKITSNLQQTFTAAGGRSGISKLAVFIGLTALTFVVGLIPR